MGNIFATLEANFVSATMFPETGNIDRKHVSATMFLSFMQGIRNVSKVSVLSHSIVLKDAFTLRSLSKD